MCINMMASYNTVHSTCSQGQNCHTRLLEPHKSNSRVDSPHLFTYPNKFSYPNTENFLSPEVFRQPRLYCIACVHVNSLSVVLPALQCSTSLIPAQLP